MTAGGTAARQAALVMISNFGSADGGRETWAYNFVPALLAREPELRLQVYGVRFPGQVDNSATLRDAVALEHRDRLAISFAEPRKGMLPASITAIGALKRLIAQTDAPPPAYVLAVGSFMELNSVLKSRRFKRSRKVAWLRSIFADEKANWLPTLVRPLAARIERRTLRRADLIIANGDDTAEQYRSMGLDVTVIKNAVQLERWQMPSGDPGHSPLRIAYIGRLAEVKGVREFAGMAALLKSVSGGEAFECHVVGEGPHDAEVRAGAERGELITHGAISNDRLPAMLGGFEVCVALTFKSAQGGGGGVSNALLEQMAAGRVIVAWDNAIFRQLLGEANAYLVPQGDVAALAEVFRQIRANPNEAAKRAAQAQADASDFSIERHMDRFAEAITALG